MIQKRFAILLACSLIAGAAIYLVTQERDPLGEMRLQTIAGSVTLLRDGEERVVEDETVIQPGDSIRTSGRSFAKLRLAGDRLAWLATSTRVDVVDTDSIEVEAGSLLAQTSEALEVLFDGVTAHASSATFRIDQGAGSARAAAYEGTLELATPGQPRLALDRLFEAGISAARLPRQARPVQLEEQAWDLGSVPRDEVPVLAHLDEIIELDLRLTGLASGLRSQLGSERPGLAYFRGLAGRKVGFMRPMLRRPVTDLLIGFTIASSGNGSLKKGVRETFRLRDDGGRWGVVAAIQKAKAKVLVSELGELIVAATRVGGGEGAGVGTASFTLAAGGSASGGGPTGSTSTGGGSGPSGSGSGGGGGGGGGGGDDPDPAEDCEGTTECAIKEVTDRVPRPTPTPSDGPLLNLP